jgi:hypothetical protein
MQLWNYLTKLEQNLRKTLFSWQGLGVLATSTLIVLVVLQLMYPFGVRPQNGDEFSTRGFIPL